MKHWAWNWACRICDAMKKAPETDATTKLLDQWQREVKDMVDAENGLVQKNYGAALSLMVTAYYEHRMGRGNSEYQRQAKAEIEQLLRILKGEDVGEQIRL